MKIQIENPSKTVCCDDEIEIYDAPNPKINYNGKALLRIYVDGQIIYIYPKDGDRDSTDVIFMDKVISSDDKRIMIGDAG